MQGDDRWHRRHERVEAGQDGAGAGPVGDRAGLG